MIKVILSLSFAFVVFFVLISTLEGVYSQYTTNMCNNIPSIFTWHQAFCWFLENINVTIIGVFSVLIAVAIIKHVLETVHGKGLPI